MDILTNILADVQHASVAAFCSVHYSMPLTRWAEAHDETPAMYPNFGADTPLDASRWATSWSSSWRALLHKDMGDSNSLIVSCYKNYEYHNYEYYERIFDPDTDSQAERNVWDAGGILPRFDQISDRVPWVLANQAEGSHWIMIHTDPQAICGPRGIIRYAIDEGGVLVGAKCFHKGKTFFD